MRKNTPKSKKPKPKKRLVPIPKLKSKLWTLFSLFIRLRDSNKEGYIKCCTTGNVYPWNKSQAGHFFSQRGNPALIFEENNVHAQSPIANKLQKNNITWDYLVYIEKKIGRKELDRLASMRGKPFKLTRTWLEEKIIEYTDKVSKLKIEKNIT